jgi:rubrerythrin
MKKAFISLTPQEALHVAIFIEERNAEVYHRFAEMFAEFRDVQSLEIASVFWDMAAEERHHSTLLQQRYMERYGYASCALTEEDLQELIEVPRLESGNLFDEDEYANPAKPSARERAFQVGLEAEINARRFYAELAGMTADFPLRNLYRELAEYEKDHVEFLEKRIAQSSSNRHSSS